MRDKRNTPRDLLASFSHVPNEENPDIETVDVRDSVLTSQPSTAFTSLTKTSSAEADDQPPDGPALPPEGEAPRPDAEDPSPDSAYPGTPDVPRTAKPARRCRRPLFSEEQFARYLGRWWPMPSDWGRPRSSLYTLWSDGGPGAISILPIVGSLARAKPGESREWHLSIEELARLAGVDPATAAKGKDALQALGLVHTELAHRFGQATTRWRVSDEMAAPLDGTGRHKDYFYFPLRLVYGGNWARLSAVQRLMYLALGSQAATYTDPPFALPMLRTAREAGLPMEDIGASRHKGDDAWVRLACVSYHELADITAASRAALKHGAAGLKVPIKGTWNESLLHAPLAVYPGESSNVYHFRDHAPHWPWHELNRALFRKAA